MTDKGQIIYDLVTDKAIAEADLTPDLKRWLDVVRPILDHPSQNPDVPEDFLSACLEAARKITGVTATKDLRALRNNLRYSNMLSSSKGVDDIEAGEEDRLCVPTSRHISFVAAALEAGFESPHWFEPCLGSTYAHSSGP